MQTWHAAKNTKNNDPIRSLTLWLYPTKTCDMPYSRAIKKCCVVVLISKYITGLENTISFFHQENQKYLERDESLQFASAPCWTLGRSVFGDGDRMPPHSCSFRLVEHCSSWCCWSSNYLKFFPLPPQLLVASISPHTVSLLCCQKNTGSFSMIRLPASDFPLLEGQAF